MLIPSNTNHFELTAEPEGVYREKLMQNDMRKPCNLYNGKNLTKEYKNIWLTLFVKKELEDKTNELNITFKHPVVFGLINIWNYQRNPERGVK